MDTQPPGVEYDYKRLYMAQGWRVYAYLSTFIALRAIDPRRAIVIDGLAGGGVSMPGLVDLGVSTIELDA